MFLLLKDEVKIGCRIFEMGGGQAEFIRLYNDLIGHGIGMVLSFVRSNVDTVDGCEYVDV